MAIISVHLYGLGIRKDFLFRRDFETWPGNHLGPSVWIRDKKGFPVPQKTLATSAAYLRFLTIPDIPERGT
ncbi:MAG: hypothetical protein DRI57_26380 [Deltaproteobacteria bacterium]|nr:MAG: hypothetical protein DRI57_26380 [Deltaproteobacteria bacterium]